VVLLCRAKNHMFFRNRYKTLFLNRFRKVELMQKIHVGFLGAGGIAQAHVYAIQALKFYYNTVPEIVLESVASARPESRAAFAKKYGFKTAESVEKFAENRDVEAVFI